MAAPLRATFYAFRRQGRGGVLTRAALVHASLLLALLTIFVVFLGAVGALTTTGELAPIVGLSVVALLLLCHAVISASYEAACLRWMIRGETGGFGGFSLGADTWRVYAGYWIWFGVSFGVWLVVMALSVLLVAAFNLGEAEDTRVFIGYGAVSLWVLMVSPLAIRMSPGNAVSVARQKLSYAQAWKASSDRVRALAGSHLIAWTIWLIVWVAFFIGGSFLIFTLIGDAMENTERENALMFVNMAISTFCANFLLTFLAAGINARAVLAAVEEGKLEGVGATTDIAEAFT